MSRSFSFRKTVQHEILKRSDKKIPLAKGTICAMADMCAPRASRYSAHTEDHPTATSASTYASLCTKDRESTGAPKNFLKNFAAYEKRNSSSLCCTPGASVTCARPRGPAQAPSTRPIYCERAIFCGLCSDSACGSAEKSFSTLHTWVFGLVHPSMRNFRICLCAFKRIYGHRG